MSTEPEAGGLRPWGETVDVGQACGLDPWPRDPHPHHYLCTVSRAVQSAVVRVEKKRELEGAQGS